MNKFSFFLLLTLFVNILNITASNSIRFQFLPDAPIDSIKVENLDNQTTHTFTGGSELLFFFGVPTSVEKLIPSDDELRVFSFPNQREVYILFNTKTSGSANCEIFNTQGRLVSSANGNLKEESHSFTFIPDTKGVYLVRVTSGTTTRTAKFISYSTASVPSLFKNGSSEKDAFKAPSLSYEIGRLVVNQNDLLRIQCYSGTKSQTIYDYATSDKNYTIRFVNRYHKFRLYNIAASKPGLIDVMFSLTDAANKGIDDLKNQDFLVKEDGAVIQASESFRHVYQVNPVPFQVVLLIDNSTSIVNDLQEIKQSTLQFIRKIRPFQQFALYVFSDGPVMLQDFTNDTTKLKQAVEKIGLGYPSTNLYGSVISALSKWTDDFSLTNLKQGALVLFTDGNDTQGTSTINQVINTRGQKKVYVIGMGKEVTPSILNQISYPNQYISIQSSTELESAYSQIQADIIRESNSFYWLNYMSPKRSGIHSLSVSITGNTNSQASANVTGNFSANGFRSVNSGVFVNNSDEKPYGIDSIFCFYDGVNYNFTTSRYGDVQSKDSFVLKPITYWAFKKPEYEWLLSDNSQFELNSSGYFHLNLIPRVADTLSSILTIEDKSNGYSKQLKIQMYPEKTLFNMPTVQDISSTSATLKGAVIQEGRLPIVERGFVWSTEPNPTINLNTKTTEGTGTGKLTTSITGLKSGTEYYIRSYATNSSGTAYGEELTFTTEAGVPELVTKSVVPISLTSLSTGGIITHDGGSKIVSYGVCWNENENPTVNNNISTVVVDGDEYSIIIDSLVIGQKYYVRSFARNSIGIGYGNEIILHSTLNEGEVYNSITGKVWMDRNLGAQRVALNLNDTAAFGDLYQWGRLTDGHEKRTSDVRDRGSDKDVPGHGDYITAALVGPRIDWRLPQNNNLWQGVNGVNNPCPEGFRIPTSAEWAEEMASWVSSDAEGAFISSLKLPLAGYRENYNGMSPDGGIYNIGLVGFYWSSSVEIASFPSSYDESSSFIIDDKKAIIEKRARVHGLSVRCIKE